MSRVAARSLLCLPLFLLLAGCSVDAQTQRIGRLVEAARTQPQIQPPAEFVPSSRAVVGTDPIAKADVLVFATRPGDAVVSAFAAIKQAKEDGKRVVIVYLTNGDAQTDVARALAGLPSSATPTPGQYLRAADVLQELALTVTGSALGMTRDDVFFLGYPDGALHEFTDAAPDHVVRSPYTAKDGLFDAGTSPYRIARSGQGVPYSFNAILHDLNDILIELNPRDIYLPAPASADETSAAAGRLIARSLREVAPGDAEVFAYMRYEDIRSPPDVRVVVAVPAEKQLALDTYAGRIGIANWLDVPPALLRAEPFWHFDYTNAT